MPVTTPESRPEDAPETRRSHRQRAAGARLPAGFRPDVEGLRAVAVLLVMVYHAGVTWLPGGFVGVDVFFVVSGFVITNQLLRELEGTGRLSLVRFYSRRAKRLLPAAGLVLVVTAVACWLAVSRVQWQQIGGDIAGAAAYVVNWVFAARSVDYLAEDVEPSPVLHYWSLAVEEQFYLIWPLVMLGIFAFLRRRARGAGHRDGLEGTPDGVRVPRRRDVAVGLLAVVVVPSLIFSAVYTWIRPEQAFFVTPTRLWELGAGGLVAVGAGYWPRWGSERGRVLAWGGLAAVLVSGVLVTSGWAWPGVAAVLPVLGTVAVIIGGFTAPGVGAARLLSWRPLVWIGGLSYSLYLWHWPLLRLWDWEFGEPGPLLGLVVVALSVVPAWLSYTFVESPIRHSPTLNEHPRYALSVGANSTLVALLCGLLLVQGAQLGGAAGGQPTGAGWARTSSPGAAGPDGPGAPAGTAASTTADVGGEVGSGAAGDGAQGDGALHTADRTGGTTQVSTGLPLPGVEQPGDQPFFDALTPDPLQATADVPSLYDLGCQRLAEETTSEPCEFGDLDGDVVVAVVGDSKAAQWVPALETIAQERGWLIRVYTKQACALSDSLVVDEGGAYTSCRDWGRDVLERLTGEEHADVLITSSIRSLGLPADDAEEMTREGMVDGYVRFWTTLHEEGTRVIALSDTPSPDLGRPVYECVEEHRDDPSACSWSYEVSPGSLTLRAAVDRVPDAQFVDMDPWVCPGGTCVGDYRNVLTYRQGSHITVTFVSVLTEPLAAHIVPLVEWQT